MQVIQDRSILKTVTALPASLVRELLDTAATLGCAPEDVMIVLLRRRLARERRIDIMKEVTHER
jgi:hypothetical protein